MIVGSRMVLLLLLSLAIPEALYAQQQPAASDSSLSRDLAKESDSWIVTDRPDITEAGVVVPRLSLQFESGITWTQDHGKQVADASETLFRFGVSDRTELRIVLPNYIWAFSGSEAASGFDDLALGVKHQLGPLHGFDVSVIAALSLPTGAFAISSHGFDPFVKLPWSRELRGGWSVGGMQSLFTSTQSKKPDTSWESTFYVEKEILRSWDVFAEYGTDYGSHEAPNEIVHLGTAYRFKRRQQLDFHFGFGTSRAAANYFIAIGYSVRFDGLRHH